MKFTVQGKNIEITEAMKEQIEKKLSVLDKYVLIEEDTVARVVARVYKKGQKSEKVEITIPTKVGILRTEVVHDDFYAAVDYAIDKLEDQLRRQKTRLQKKHKEHLSRAFIEENVAQDAMEETPVKTKQIIAKKMPLDEAILQMELSGHSFYIYTDEETEKHAIVYLRHDGTYGLIEVEDE